MRKSGMAKCRNGNRCVREEACTPVEYQGRASVYKFLGQLAQRLGARDVTSRSIFNCIFSVNCMHNSLQGDTAAIRRS